MEYRRQRQMCIRDRDDVTAVSIHLRYLQTMLKIHRPVEKDMAHIVPMPLEVLKYWVGMGGLDKIAKRMKEKLRRRHSNKSYTKQH